MARGISEKELYPYVLEADRGLPVEQQTVFHMKPKSGHDANLQTKVYLKAYKEKDNGVRELDVDKADYADIENFKATCRKVENFAFPDDYYEKHEAVAKMANEVNVFEDGEDVKVLFVPEITDAHLIGDVFRCLDSESIRELTTASNSVSKLKEGQKK